jgi:hypothetical protein
MSFSVRARCGPRSDRSRPVNPGHDAASAGSARRATAGASGSVRKIAVDAWYDDCSTASVYIEPVESLSRYTARCIHCARIAFRAARRLGDIQFRIIESHVLVCRPLATIETEPDLLAHFTITETTS